MTAFEQSKSINDGQSANDSRRSEQPAFKVEFSVRNPSPPPSAGDSDTAAKHLPPLTIHSPDAPTTQSADKPLPSARGWHMYGSSAGDSITAGPNGSIDIKIANNNDPQHEPGVFKKVDIPSNTKTDAPAGELPVHVEFWAKSISPPSDPSNTSKPESLNMTLIESKAPYAQTLNEKVNLTSKWQKFDFDGVAAMTEDGLALHFKTVGDVELKKISVTPESLEKAGVNPADLTPEGMQKNIDKNRKTELNITVLDSHGKPIPDAKIEIHQKTQSFLFGTEVQQLNPNDKSPEQKKYQDAFSDTFNYASVTPYWPQTEKQVAEGKPGGAGAETKIDYSSFDNQIDWLSQASTDHNVPVKLTPFFWPHYTPKFVGTDPTTAGVLADQHTTQETEHFAQFPNVKVIENNEVAAALNDKSNNGVTKMVQQQAAEKHDGGAGVVEHQTNIEKGVLGKNKDSSVQIMYNDYVENLQELQLLDRLQKDGKLPDQIGIQMHMTQGEWPLAKVQKIVQELSKYGKPLYISEISVVSGDHRLGSDDSSKQTPWPSTPEGLQRQADYVEKLYTLLYSNDAVKGITWWDLTDKKSWQGAPRGLLNADMSHKPAYDRLHDLIRTSWMTNSTGKTDNNGESQSRVFLGDYDITVTDKNGNKTTKTIHVDKNNADSTDATIELP